MYGQTGGWRPVLGVNLVRQQRSVASSLLGFSHPHGVARAVEAEPAPLNVTAQLALDLLELDGGSAERTGLTVPSHATHHALLLTRQLAGSDTLARESAQIIFSNVHR
jgi:hypothetical protein